MWFQALGQLLEVPSLSTWTWIKSASLDPLRYDYWGKEKAKRRREEGEGKKEKMVSGQASESSDCSGCTVLVYFMLCWCCIILVAYFCFACIHDKDKKKTERGEQ